MPGLLERFPDEASLIERIPAADLAGFMELAQNRMKKKVMGAGEALAGGVRKVIFADGRINQPVQQALSGKGTIIA